MADTASALLPLWRNKESAFLTTKIRMCGNISAFLGENGGGCCKVVEGIF